MQTIPNYLAIAGRMLMYFATLPFLVPAIQIKWIDHSFIMD